MSVFHQGVQHHLCETHHTLYPCISYEYYDQWIGVTTLFNVCNPIWGATYLCKFAPHIISLYNIMISGQVRLLYLTSVTPSGVQHICANLHHILYFWQYFHLKISVFFCVISIFVSTGGDFHLGCLCTCSPLESGIQILIQT